MAVYITVAFNVCGLMKFQIYGNIINLFVATVKYELINKYYGTIS